MNMHVILRDALQQKFNWKFTIMYMCGTDGAKPCLKRLPSEIPLIIVRRNRLDDEFKKLQTEYAKNHRVMFVPEWHGPDTSSSKIRTCMAAQDEAALRSMLNPNVLRYLREHKLADGLKS